MFSYDDDTWYVKAPLVVTDDKRLTPTDVLVYEGLVRWGWRKREFGVRQKTLAGFARCSTKQVHLSVVKLTGVGLVSWRRPRPASSNLYVLEPSLLKVYGAGVMMKYRRKSNNKEPYAPPCAPKVGRRKSSSDNGDVTPVVPIPGEVTSPGHRGDQGKSLPLILDDLEDPSLDDHGLRAKRAGTSCSPGNLSPEPGDPQQAKHAATALQGLGKLANRSQDKNVLLTASAQAEEAAVRVNWVGEAVPGFDQPDPTKLMRSDRARDGFETAMTEIRADREQNSPQAEADDQALPPEKPQGQEAPFEAWVAWAAGTIRQFKTRGRGIKPASQWNGRDLFEFVNALIQEARPGMPPLLPTPTLRAAFKRMAAVTGGQQAKDRYAYTIERWDYFRVHLKIPALTPTPQIVDGYAQTIEEVRTHKKELLPVKATFQEQQKVSYARAKDLDFWKAKAAKQAQELVDARERKQLRAGP